MSRWLLLLVIPLVLTAGPAAADEVRTTAVGKVQGTEAFLAVTYDGHRLRAYACDGSARRLPTISTWFEARWDGRSPIAVDDLRIDRVHGDGRVTGRLGRHRFTLDPASGPAGLYDRTRWNLRRTSVVLADGSVRGTFVSPRPPKCRAVVVTGPNGATQVATVCG